MKHYLYKVIPPRPDFPQAMTADETKIMQAHVDYWSGLLKQGKVLAFGPVVDPAGGYGIAIIRLPDEANPSTLCDDDPAIKADVGFRSEIFFMPRTVSIA